MCAESFVFFFWSKLLAQSCYERSKTLVPPWKFCFFSSTGSCCYRQESESNNNYFELLTFRKYRKDRMQKTESFFQHLQPYKEVIEVVSPSWKSSSPTTTIAAKRPLTVFLKPSKQAKQKGNSFWDKLHIHYLKGRESSNRSPKASSTSLGKTTPPTQLGGTGGLTPKSCIHFLNLHAGSPVILIIEVWKWDLNSYHSGDSTPQNPFFLFLVLYRRVISRQRCDYFGEFSAANSLST